MVATASGRSLQIESIARLTNEARIRGERHRAGLELRRSMPQNARPIPPETSVSSM
jgi:hypothetical protein